MDYSCGSERHQYYVCWGLLTVLRLDKLRPQGFQHPFRRAEQLCATQVGLDTAWKSFRVGKGKAHALYGAGEFLFQPSVSSQIRWSKHLICLTAIYSLSKVMASEYLSWLLFVSEVSKKSREQDKVSRLQSLSMLCDVLVQSSIRCAARNCEWFIIVHNDGTRGKLSSR